MVGGAGNDSYILNNPLDIVVEQNGEGNDTVTITSGTSYTLTADVENLIIAGATVYGTGNSLANVITDTGNVANYLSGDSGNDTISAANGSDTLVGGSGVDQLTGGANADYFVFNDDSDSGIGSGNRDIITDFSKAQTDKLDLSGFAGTFTFRGTSAFTGTAEEVRYSTSGGTTVVEIDSNGDGTTDLEVQLTGTITLVSGDFIL